MNRQTLQKGIEEFVNKHCLFKTEAKRAIFVSDLRRIMDYYAEEAILHGAPPTTDREHGSSLRKKSGTLSSMPR